MLAGAEGQPWCTSHYGYYMSSWHLIFALSGQRFHRGNLSLAPRQAEPYSLPVLVPRTVATISAQLTHGEAATSKDTVRFTLRVHAGKPLTLTALDVKGVRPPASVLPATLALGETLSWGLAQP